jgi:type I restriction enzyme R subunit
MTSNFHFLHSNFPALEKLGDLAERYLYSDPNSCMIKLGMLAELVVRYMFELDRIPFPETDDTTANRIRILKRADLLPHPIPDLLYHLRTKRNQAVHEIYESSHDAEILLRFAHSLSSWFARTYGDPNCPIDEFRLPENIQAHSLPEENREEEREVQRMETEKAVELAPALDATVSSGERQKRGETANASLQLSEKETRVLIDSQLREAGWEADSENLRYSRGTRPQKGKAIAIAEWPADTVLNHVGHADYALFIGERLIGIVEAKAAFKDISSVIDNQSKEYATHIRAADAQYLTGRWGEFQVPFLFATNGRPYLKQLETKSGIWFRDARDERNTPHALQGWFSPQGLLDKLALDIRAADESLTHTPYDLLLDPDGLNLRPYQVEAIQAVEQALVSGNERRALLAMATGTGKTRTMLGMIYRFLKAKRFNRILFLVDRTALGEQAADVFREVRLEELMTLDSLYNIKGLEEQGIDRETKLHIATVQSLVRRILYGEGGATPAVSDYDLIVVDEAHRGYLLDKDLSDEEFAFRDQKDFISKYRAVLEYFDAVKVAVTATPALHTAQIFGDPVFTYGYRRAVLEGYLVDHDAPHNIVTKLRRDGIKFRKGETMPLFDPSTNSITNSATLPDEVDFNVESFNRKVITEAFNRTVLAEIARDIDPEGEGKTLIYAVDDAHADLIVKILRELYEPMGVASDAIMKITGSIGGGNRKKILEAIKRYKNEKFPNIVVTVDLLTTGIDVPAIVNLVFLRRVKSRILYEQMLGRATRLCPEIHKTKFEIYDAVGIYEAMEKVSDMRPVSQKDSTSFKKLLEGLKALERSDAIKSLAELIVAKMQRKKRTMDGPQLEKFKTLSGGQTPTEFAEGVLKMSPLSAKEHLLKHADALIALDKMSIGPGEAKVISYQPDELDSHTRGYGEKGEAPEDYLAEFKKYIADNADKIAALKTVCSRPRDLTRDSLKSLKAKLDEKGFTEVMLNSAWKDSKNEDIAADIIGFIREAALGAKLISHEERVKTAIAKLEKAHDFTAIEKRWLDRIEKVLLQENVLDEQIFDTGAFSNYGGFKQINQLFKGRLQDYMEELKDYLYDDGALAA